MTKEQIDLIGKAINTALYTTPYDGVLNIPCLSKEQRDAAAEAALRVFNQPQLGCATTRQLLEEIRARIEVHGNLDYRTIDVV